MHPVTHVARIPEIVVPGKRLGRHIEHDPDSKAFATSHVVPVVSKSLERMCPPFNQGDLGSCTGNAMAGALMTEGLWRPTLTLGEKEAVLLYERATRLDRIPGAYPPDDTGSSGLSVARAAKQATWIRAYHHAFGLHAALAAMMLGPVIIGINWYEGFDAPSGPLAILDPNGEIRGGHEVELLGVDVEAKLVRGVNSWGTEWGDKGYFCFTYDTFDRLLHEQGDVVVPVA